MSVSEPADAGLHLRSKEVAVAGSWLLRLAALWRSLLGLFSAHHALLLGRDPPGAVGAELYTRACVVAPMTSRRVTRVRGLQRALPRHPAAGPGTTTSEPSAAVVADTAPAAFDAHDRYTNANAQFVNLDRLIHYTNLDGRLNVFYSTPSGAQSSGTLFVLLTRLAGQLGLPPWGAPSMLRSSPPLRLCLHAESCTAAHCVPARQGS